MTKPNRPISVRLEAGLEAALDDYCARTGVTRSYAVQEGLTEYLVSRQGPTLSSLAEAILPRPAPARKDAVQHLSRQQRYREYVRAKHRR